MAQFGLKSFENANIYVEGQGIVRTSVTFGERIEQIGKAGGERIPVSPSCVILPGFIDQHVHGAGGADAMDASADALYTIANTVAAEGTTRFLATTMTQSPARISAAMRAVCAYRAQNPDSGAALLGAHLEGPFISTEHLGAQAAEFVAEPNVALFDAWQKESGGAVKMVTLAPETAGANELVRHITACGVAASAGHTNADYGTICTAMQNGLRCITHTFNAQRGVHHREIGTAGAALLNDDLYAELIADTVHVSVPAMRLLAKCKPKNKLILITDAIRAKGLGDGESELGGQKVFVRGTEARLASGALAGSVLTMAVAVRHMVQNAGVSLVEASDYASKNPAEHLGVYDTLGGIAAGKCADFVVLDADFSVACTVRDGRVIYKRDA